MIADNLKKRIYTSVVLLLLVILIFNFNPLLTYFLIIVGVVSFLEFMELTKKIFIKKIHFIFVNLFFGLYLFTFCSIFFLYSQFLGFKIILFIFLSGCIASDIGGYIFGNIFKGPKLTKISPKKTYAGAVGSIFFTVIIVSFFFYYFIQIFNYKIIYLSLIISLFCQLGDLIFSLLKRKAKIKDTGKILPGHGGILDRVDGILLGIPIGLITLLFLN